MLKSLRGPSYLVAEITVLTGYSALAAAPATLAGSILRADGAPRPSMRRGRRSQRLGVSELSMRLARA